MQFIDFKAEHFSKNEETGEYFLEIPKVEVGFKDIEVQEKQEDGPFSKADYQSDEDIEKITIRMKKPRDIRVNF